MAGAFQAALIGYPAGGKAAAGKRIAGAGFAVCRRGQDRGASLVGPVGFGLLYGFGLALGRSPTILRAAGCAGFLAHKYGQARSDNNCCRNGQNNTRASAHTGMIADCAAGPI